MKTISIVMPAYNAEKYIADAIKSVQRQTYGEFELIIVDDSSTDSTFELANGFAENDKRIKVLQRENGGAGESRNTGMSAVTGEITYFMDSDDTIAPNALETIADTFEKYEPDIVEFGIKHYSGNGTIKGESSPRLEKILFTGDEVRNYILAETLATSPEQSTPNGLSVYVWATAYSTAFLKKVNFRMVSEREYIYEDYYAHLQLFGQAERVAIIPDMLYNYMQHSDSVLQKYQPERFERVRKLYIEALALCDKMNYCENVRKRTGWFFICNTNFAMYEMMKHVPAAREQKRILKTVLNDEYFKRAVSEWKKAKLPRSRRILFTAFRLKSAVLLRWLYGYEMRNMKK